MSNKWLLYENLDPLKANETLIEMEMHRVRRLVIERLRAIHPTIRTQIFFDFATVLTCDFMYGPEELPPPS